MLQSKAKKRFEARKARQKRVRKRVRGSDQRPRLCVYRSLHYTYAQLISDESGKIIAAVSSKTLAAKGSSTKSVDAAKEVGKSIATLAKKAKIEQVVFDRNGYLFHGRVSAVAEGAREAGLKI